MALLSMLTLTSPHPWEMAFLPEPPMFRLMMPADRESRRSVVANGGAARVVPAPIEDQDKEPMT